ncbi:MAG: magnesium transporter CorA family protein [Microthrixaceae bacterium]
MPTQDISDQKLAGASLVAHGRRIDEPTWGDLRRGHTEGELMWVDVQSPSHDELVRLADVFGFREEMVRDSEAFHQRTRLADYGGYLLVVMYAVAPDSKSLVEVHLYLTRHSVLSIRRQPCAQIEELLGRAEHFANSQPTVPALLSWILAGLVATFADALEKVDDELTDLEGRILDGKPDQQEMDDLLKLRRRVNSFRRSVDPARELVGVGRFVMVDALEDVSDDARRHLRDLAVDLAHVGDMLEGERDRLSAVMDVYMSQVNNRQNRIMQQLAVVSTVFLPLTFLTGYFGMNFANDGPRRGLADSLRPGRRHHAPRRAGARARAHRSSRLVERRLTEPAVGGAAAAVVRSGEQPGAEGRQRRVVQSQTFRGTSPRSHRTHRGRSPAWRSGTTRSRRRRELGLRGRHLPPRIARRPP